MTLPAVELDDLIDPLLALPARSRTAGLTPVMELLMPQFHRWAPRLCRDFGGGNPNHLDDIVAVCAEQTFRMLREKQEAPRGGWGPYVYGACRHHVAQYFQSSAVTPASGMTAALRRHAYVQAHHKRLQDLTGRVPAAADVVAAANAETRASRVDAARQGALVTEEDLTLPAVSLPLLETDVVQDDDSFPISEVEARELIAMTIEACYDESDELGEVAEAWVGRMYAEPPVLGTPKEVSVELGIEPAKAWRLVQRARKLAAKLCVEKLGIQSPF